MEQPEICLRSSNSRDSEPFRSNRGDFKGFTANSLSDHTTPSWHPIETTIHGIRSQRNVDSNATTNDDRSFFHIHEAVATFHIVADGTSELAYLAEGMGAKASQQERNHSLACSYDHRNIRGGKLQAEGHDIGSICLLCDHTLIAVD